MRIAAIVTSFFPNSHASVLLTKFINGFPTDDGLIQPRTQLVSLYIDQIHRNDIGLQLAHEYRIPVYESIQGALTNGLGKLAVDAVLLIAEHGDYPRTPLGQEMLPRRYFFEQIFGVLGARPIPVFNDKFLAYRWEDALWMYQTATAHGIPLWAGSALPTTWRNPDFEHPLDAPLERALVIGFHMLERYGFHALESLQCQVERRSGGEHGVASVQCVSGKAALDQASNQYADLVHSALHAIEGGPRALDPARVVDPHLIRIEYRDGLDGAALMLGDTGFVNKFAYAQGQGSRIDSLEYHLESGPSAATFSYLGLNVEDFFLSGHTPSPVERTLLTTGILEAALRSWKEGGRRIDTPHLDIQYQPAKARARRPTQPRPSGASLDPWPLPEPGATPRATRIPITTEGTTRGPHFGRTADG